MMSCSTCFTTSGLLIRFMYCDCRSTGSALLPKGVEVARRPMWLVWLALEE